MYYTDDPHRDFDRHEANLQKELNKQPVCVDCDEPIQDDHLFDVDGDLFCEECMIANFKRNTENYIKEG